MFNLTSVKTKKLEFWQFLDIHVLRIEDKKS